MKLTPPTQNVFYISAVLAILGILGKYAGITALAGSAFLLILAAYVLLFLGNSMKGF